MKNKNLEFWEGLPFLEKVQGVHDCSFHFITMDDLMEHFLNSIDTQDIFTK